MRPLCPRGNSIPIGIGVLLDLNSSIGTMAQTCISLGLTDFYNHNNASYVTKLSLHIRDTHNDIVTAASAALDLIDNQNVHAIIGPQNSGEARFVAEIGTKAQIPIISFSATSPSLSPSQTPYFVRTTQSDLSQVEAICAIAQAYGWQKIILISENTEYGNGLIPYLAAALGEISIQVPYRTAIDPHSQEAEISKEVKKLKGMQTKKLDVIIGDITIQWNRTRCVDFTTSYLESSVWMVVSFKSGNTTWTLFRPFHWSLWLFILELFPIVTLVIYILEFEIVKSSVDNNIIRFLFTIYTHSERLVSNWSRCLAITSFGVFVIILQVYTANLTSILSEERAMVASVSNVKEIKSKDYNVGYQRGSWVKGFLIEELGLKESQLKGYGTPEEYSKALSLGSKKGGVDAIFDETPYLSLFLSNYGHDKYTMAGPPYQTHGFGFAFPKKSGIVSYLSSAILKVSEDIDVFEGIKGKYSINTNIPSQYPKHARSLTLQDFIVFFLVIMVFAEVAFGVILWGYIKFRFFRGEYSPSSQPPGTTLDTTASEDHHTCLSPHHDDTFDDDIYHSDYY